MEGKLRLLIVDDDVKLCETIADIFWEKGYTVDMAYNGRQALEKLADRFFNVVLLDIKLSNADGIELLKILKEAHPEAEVIIITGYATLESAVEALTRGAFAYVRKPLAMDEVIAAVEQAIQKQQLVLTKERHAVAERQGREYYRLGSITDGLTELYAHSYFRDLLIREIALAERYSHPVSLLMIDIDDFKDYNDKHGHLAGDKALRNIAKTLKVSCRSVDVIARYGGEEFAILMPFTPRGGGYCSGEAKGTGVKTSTGAGAYCQHRCLQLPGGCPG